MTIEQIQNLRTAIAAGEYPTSAAIETTIDILRPLVTVRPIEED